MARSGAIGAFQWVELPSERYDIPTVVRHLAGEIVGLTAVNVSWDSGRLMPSSDPEAAGWQEINGLAVSPVLDTELLSNWPASSCQGGRYDEWYFFRTVDPTLKLDPFGKPRESWRAEAVPAAKAGLLGSSLLTALRASTPSTPSR